MVEKGINFIFYLGTAYDISMHGKYWELWVIFVGGMYTPLKMFLSLSFSLWALAPHKSLLPSAKGLSFTLCNFYFQFESPSSLIKAPTRRQYDRTWVLGVVNMWVCFMNGSMIEYDGLGSTYFSVDILKDMVACWYAWVFKLSCEN